MGFLDQFQNRADFYNQLSPDQQAVAGHSTMPPPSRNDPQAQQYAQIWIPTA